MKNLLYRLALKLLPWSDICQKEEPYLRTFFIWRPKWSEKLFGLKTGGIYLHQFLKSDVEYPHDHSWPYTTIVLRGGYRDMTYSWDGEYLHFQPSEFLRPGMIVSRKPNHIHNVELLDPDKPAWTLMFVGPIERDFYFYTNKGPVLWWKHLGFSSKPA